MSALFHGRKLASFGDHSCEDYCTCDPEPVENPGDADLVTSELPSGEHMPVIDLDLSCELVQSGTPGHHHLYINKAIPFAKFVKVLEAMEDAGLVQPGFVNGTVGRGFASVRVPWKPKPRPQPQPELAPF